MTGFATVRPRRQAGFNLVEIMVSLGLGLVLLVGTGAIYLGSKQSFLSQSQEGNARIQETGRYMLELMGQSLRQAGNSETSDPNWPFFGGVAIYGTEGGGALPDKLVVQFDAAAGDTDCNGNPAIAGQRVQNTFNLNTALLQLRCEGKVATVAFGDPDPQQAGLGFPLVDNIQDFQVIYGIDITSSTPGKPDQSADQYVTANMLQYCPAGKTSVDLFDSANPYFCQVISVRVCFLVRSASAGAVKTNKVGANLQGQKYMNCGGALGTATGAAAYTTATDSYLRRAFVSTFTLRTRAP